MCGCKWLVLIGVAASLFLVGTVCALVCPVNSAVIVNQDGIGASGWICANPVNVTSVALYKSWPSGLTLGTVAFYGGAFDGTSIWLAPFMADGLVKVNRTTGAMTLYNSWPSGLTLGACGFAGAVFDGQYIWLTPATASGVVRVARTSGSMTMFNTWPAGLNKGLTLGFVGAAFDGQDVWLVPYAANGAVKVTAATGGMNLFSAWPAGLNRGTEGFAGAVFDGKTLWLVPYSANGVVQITSMSSGSMTLYNSWPSGLTSVGQKAFTGGIFDGKYVWLVPYTANGAVKIDPSTGFMSLYRVWPAGFTKNPNAFSGGVFDGQSIWLCPNNGTTIVKISTSTGNMTVFNRPTFPTAFTAGMPAFGGSVFDGQDIWLLPRTANGVIRLVSSSALGATKTPSDVSPSQSTASSASSTGSAMSSVSRSVSGLPRSVSSTPSRRTSPPQALPATGVPPAAPITTIAPTTAPTTAVVTAAALPTAAASTAPTAANFRNRTATIEMRRSLSLTTSATTTLTVTKKTRMSSAESSQSASRHLQSQTIWPTTPTVSVQKPTSQCARNVTLQASFLSSGTKNVAGDTVISAADAQGRLNVSFTFNVSTVLFPSIQAVFAGAVTMPVGSVESYSFETLPAPFASAPTQLVVMTVAVDDSLGRYAAAANRSERIVWTLLGTVQFVSNSVCPAVNISVAFSCIIEVVPQSVTPAAAVVVMVQAAALASTQTSIAAGVVASTFSGSSGASDMQSVVLLTLARCSTHTTVDGGFKLLTPFALSDSAAGALSGNLVTSSVLLACQAAVYGFFVLVKKQAPDKAFAGARPGYQLVFLASLHQSTLYSSMMLFGEGGGYIVFGLLGFLMSITLPVGLVGAAALVPRRFVQYTVDPASRYAQAPWRYLTPTGTVLPHNTRMKLSSLVASLTLPNPALVLVSFMSSFFTNIVAILPVDTPTWLCKFLMFLSAGAHFLLAAAVAAAGLYRLPTSRILDAAGLAMTGVFQVQIAAGWRNAVDGTLTAQAMLSIVRTLSGICIALMERQMQWDPTVVLKMVLWQVGDGGEALGTDQSSHDNLQEMLLKPSAVEATSCPSATFLPEVPPDEIELPLQEVAATRSPTYQNCENDDDDDL